MRRYRQAHPASEDAESALALVATATAILVALWVLCALAFSMVPA